MRCVIAGSRGINDYELVRQAVADSGFVITEVVSGTAPGVDRLGERWARENNVPVRKFPADWDRYGRRAGFLRNKEMVEYVAPDGGVIAVWDGSVGTKHTIDLATRQGVKLYVAKVG